MTPTFENLPGLVEGLQSKVDKLTILIQNLVKIEPLPEPDEVRLYGDKELAEYLHCNIQTIYRLKKAKKIPFRKYGRKYFYLRSEIDLAFSGKGGKK
jgi:excisionase family DNA binding protein